MYLPVIPPSSNLEEDDDWIAEIGEIKTAEDWYKYYPDRCMSNQTIWSVMTKTIPPNESRLGHIKYGTPQGARGFERCYNLLKLWPTWRYRIKEVSAKFPEWEGFAREWEKLTKLYESGNMKDLSNLIDKLNQVSNLRKLSKPNKQDGIIYLDTFDKSQLNKR
jgi:hypothetical protein